MSHQQFHETLDLSIVGSMGRVHRLCRDAVTVAVEPLGLTQSRWTALVHIDTLGEGVTQLALATSLGIEMPSLTRTIKQLEEQQLISRQVDKNDKRSKKLYFTEQGRQVLESLQQKLADIKQQLYKTLTHQQLNEVAHALVQLEKNALACIEAGRA